MKRRRRLFGMICVSCILHAGCLALMHFGMYGESGSDHLVRTRGVSDRMVVVRVVDASDSERLTSIHPPKGTSPVLVKRRPIDRQDFSLVPSPKDVPRRSSVTPVPVTSPIVNEKPVNTQSPREDNLDLRPVNSDVVELDGVESEGAKTLGNMRLNEKSTDEEGVSDTGQSDLPDTVPDRVENAGTQGGAENTDANSVLSWAPPQIIERMEPVYPRRARTLGVEGEVILEVSIDAEGRRERIDVVQSSGRLDLDAAAEDAVKTWTFAPARSDGVAVEGVLRVVVTFQLH